MTNLFLNFAKKKNITTPTVAIMAIRKTNPIMVDTAVTAGFPLLLREVFDDSIPATLLGEIFDDSITTTLVAVGVTKPVLVLT